MNENTENEQLEQLPADKKLQLEIEKLTLESQKIDQEIRHLKRPLLKNPQYLAPILTMCSVVLTILYSFFSGFWDIQMKKLENTKLVLQIDIDKFEKQKDTLNKQLVEYRQQRDAIIQQNIKLKQKYEEANKKYNDIANRYKNQKEDIAKELLEIDDLINTNKNKEAFEKLRKVVIKLKGWENKEFNPFEFNPNEFN